jgi:hypothetical protein
LTIGGIISVVLTRATGIQLGRETTDVLGVLLHVFTVVTVVFAASPPTFIISHSPQLRRLKAQAQ